MGVLKKILDSQAAAQEASPQQPGCDGGLGVEAAARPGPAPAEHPAARCLVCEPPAGRHFWLDSYGAWVCTTCHPPASMAQVRGEWLAPAPDGEARGVPGGGQETLIVGPGAAPAAGPDADSDMAPDAAQRLWEPSPGFRLLAIIEPDGHATFNLRASQAERRAALESVAWFDRNDAAEKRIAEKTTGKKA